MAAGGGGNAPPAFRSGAGAVAGIYYLSVRKGASFLCCTPLPGALDSSCCILGFSMCAVHPIGSTVIWLCCCCVLAVGTLANLTLQSALVSCPAADVSKQCSVERAGGSGSFAAGRRGCARIAIDDARAGARPGAVLVGCPCAARWTDRERAYGMPTPCCSPNAA